MNKLLCLLFGHKYHKYLHNCPNLWCSRCGLFKDIVNNNIQYDKNLSYLIKKIIKFDDRFNFK